LLGGREKGNCRCSLWKRRSAPGHLLEKWGLTRTPLTIFANISQEDISKAIVLAGMGAIVSFGVMLLLKVLIRRLREIVVLSR
jgi:hypothetical protein